MKTLKELREKTLTPAEKKKREEIAKAIEKDQPDMPMDKKMAIATAQAKKVAEFVEVDEAKVSVGDRVTLQPNKATLDRSLIGKAGVVTGMLGRDARVKFANDKSILVSPKYLTVNESVELGEALGPKAPKLKGNNGPYTRQQIEKAAKQAKVDLGAKSRMMMALRDMK